MILDRFEFDLADNSLVELEVFQRILVLSLKNRFAHLYFGQSLAMAASWFLPGSENFNFTNFEFTEEARNAVRQNIIDDVIEL